MKFGLTTDWHITAQRPSSRIDESFLLNESAKVCSLVDTWISEKVDFVIHTGDMFDAPVQKDLSVLNMVLTQLTRLKEAQIPFYMILGSHDVFGYNMESLDRTLVGILRTAGLVELLHGPFEIGGRRFLGVPSLTKHDKTAYAGLENGMIVATHNMVVPASLPYPHMLMSEFSDVRDCLFLCGHYHKSFYTRVGGNLFANPGPLVRTDIGEAQHTPHTAIIMLDGPKITLRRHTLPTQPDVFAGAVADKAVTVQLDFTAAQFEYYDLFELAKQVATKAQVAQDVTDAIIRRLEDARGSLQ